MMALKARQLTFGHLEGPPLLEKGELEIGKGECVAVTGPSGAGKSTLCHVLAGVIPRSLPGRVSGEILLFGDRLWDLPLAETVRRVGVVFQDPDAQLFFPTVEAEVAFGLENLCFPEEEMARRIGASLDFVGLSRYRCQATQDLSQGQKQLVALAAVLALEPGLLILDEIFASLDQQGAAVVQGVIADYKAKGRAVLLVEHDPENLPVVDRILHLAQGKLREVVP
ncbi:energy-coupling factor ABC transporter ATP-binding protein [Candidatus Darwinibacter acetoxidans]